MKCIIDNQVVLSRPPEGPIAAQIYGRYLGEVSLDLAGADPIVTNWSMTSIPRAISVEPVRQLLGSIDRRTAAGRRDYAILLLLARLELRSGEVAFRSLDIGFDTVVDRNGSWTRQSVQAASMQTPPCDVERIVYFSGIISFGFGEPIHVAIHIEGNTGVARRWCQKWRVIFLVAERVFDTHQLNRHALILVVGNVLTYVLDIEVHRNLFSNL
jgi:hypothetical protein